jgi:uncharacterized protein (DUF697 family)
MTNPSTPSSTTPLPELHLLGKPGTGKTAIFRMLTGRGELGTGLRMTTRVADVADLPAHAPVLRLVDHPGLMSGKPAPELPAHGAVVGVARLDDPVQAPLVDALRRLRRSRAGRRVLVVLTGAERVPDASARARVSASIRADLAQAAGGPLPWVEVGLDARGQLRDPDMLIAALSELLPGAADAAFASAGSDQEAQAFEALRPMVLRYASAAGASDLVPILGAVGVPAAQASMLAAIARARGVDWTPARAALFASALGGGALVRMGAGFALRQGAKLVPVVGQTLGAAAAGAASGAATWALGRAAHAWLWGQAQGHPPAQGDLRALYARALRDAARHARR